MEGQNGQVNPLQLMAFAFGGSANDASHSYQDNPNHKYVMTAGRNQIPHVPMPLSHWKNCWETYPGSFEYITERSVTEISRETSYHNAIVAFGFKPTDSSVGLDVEKVGGSASFQEVKYASPQNGPMNSFTNAEYQLHDQGQRSSEPYAKAVLAAPGLLSKPHSRTERRRAAVSATDRSRRLRIAERLNALHELLPHRKEGSKASQLDDIIDHIKYSQLQIKELSQSRFGGEPTTEPFVFLEGYGHYILHDQMLNEPLEEMIGKLLEVNPPAASRLLESRGLVIMSTDLVEGFHQAM